MTTKKEKMWASAKEYATRIEAGAKAKKEAKHILDRATKATEVFKLLPKKPYTAMFPRPDKPVDKPKDGVGNVYVVDTDGTAAADDHYVLGNRYLTTTGTGNLTLTADTTVTTVTGTGTWTDAGQEWINHTYGNLTINWGGNEAWTPVKKEKDKHQVIRDL